LSSARQKVLGKETVVDGQFTDTFSPRVTLRKEFVEYFLGFAEHSAKLALAAAIARKADESGDAFEVVRMRWHR
jgi:hypothetical protein